MSGVNGCHWYNPCSWFNCCFEGTADERAPLKGNERKDSQDDPHKTPESQRRGVSTPGNTPTKSPGVKADKMVTGQQWE